VYQVRKLFPENKVLRSIAEGRAPVGFFNYIKDTTILDIAGQVGFDFVIIDSEHAGMDRETIERMIIAAQLNDVLPMVRLPALIPYLMRNYMEMGAQGILIPHVNCKKDCEKAQQALRYPPYGSASCCRSIHANGFQPANWIEYLEWAQKNVSFIPMIEEPSGLENIEGILDILEPGRDMVLFGKADYVQALGTLNRDGTINTAVNDAYRKVIEECRSRKVGFMACPSASLGGQTSADVQKVIDDGCSAVVLNTDQMTLLDAMNSIVNKCRNMKLK
jgi:4-hydroxy-2-oxoheptanedioate aldolase